MSIFTGAGTAIVTPFKVSGEIDFNKFEELIEDQIAGSIDCIVVAGTTGEAATMSDEEQMIKLPVWTANVPMDGTMERLMKVTEERYNVGSIPYAVKDGILELKLEPMSCKIVRSVTPVE